MSLSIRAFPTFRFYLEGNQVDETRGANIQEVASKVQVPTVDSGRVLCVCVCWVCIDRASRLIDEVKMRQFLYRDTERKHAFYSKGSTDSRGQRSCMTLTLLLKYKGV